MLNLWSSSLSRRACAHMYHRTTVARSLPYNPVLLHFASYKSSSSTAIPSDLVPPAPVVPIVPHPVGRGHKIVEKVKEEFHRIVNGSKLLGRNTKTTAMLFHGMTKGNTLTRREKTLMITTVADLIRMVPFIVILIIPFAEFALPVLLKLFPNMLPSTLTSDSQKEASRTKKLQAKLKVIEILQAASENLALRGKLDSGDNRAVLVNFMNKISRGEEIQVEEVLAISKVFHNEFSLESLDRPQLVSLAKFFGVPAIGTSFMLQETLRFRWNLVAKDDAHILRDGISEFSPAELEEMAVARGFSHSNPHQDQKQYIEEWISLSQAKVPPYLLLLSRAHYFVKNVKRVTEIPPPVIAPFLPYLNQSNTNNVDQASESEPIDIPEKEIVSLEFKNLSHELSYNPVVSKLWERIARYTSDLKKETFGGRQEEVIHLGDDSAVSLSTVITTELRRYLQAMFVALDTNGDRKLSVEEVLHGLNASDIPVHHADVVKLFQLHDTDKDGHLSFDEFVDCLLYLRKNQE